MAMPNMKYMSDNHAEEHIYIYHPDLPYSTKMTSRYRGLRETSNYRRHLRIENNPWPDDFFVLFVIINIMAIIISGIAINADAYIKINTNEPISL